MGTTDTYDRIQAALEKRLLTLSSLPSRSDGVAAVAFENRPYTPEANSTWLLARLTPVSTSRKTAGDGGYSRLDGAFHVACRCPMGSGSGAVRVLADQVIEHFKSGTDLTDGAMSLVIIGARRDAGIQVDEWYEISVFVEWFAHSNRV